MDTSVAAQVCMSMCVATSKVKFVGEHLNYLLYCFVISKITNLKGYRPILDAMKTFATDGQQNTDTTDIEVIRTISLSLSLSFSLCPPPPPPLSFYFFPISTTLFSSLTLLPFFLVSILVAILIQL